MLVRCLVAEHRYGNAALTGFLLVFSATLGEQASAQTATPDVVVKARPAPTRKDVEQQAQAMSEVGDRFEESLARFSDPVCPAIVGLSRGQAEALVDRVRDDAGSVGMRLARAGKCTPNVAIVFVRNGQAEIRTLMRANSPTFEGLSAADRRALLDDAGPVHVWRRTSVRGRDGEALQPGGQLDSSAMFSTDMPSRILLNTRIDLNSAIMVIDVPAIDGMTVTQIADYAAIRLFARTHLPKGATRINSILSLFTPSEAAPAEMTAFDRGYLTNLYRAQAGQPAYATMGTRISLAPPDRRAGVTADPARP